MLGVALAAALVFGLIVMWDLTLELASEPHTA